ncbi:TraR/DksA family transcriptional regulator [Acerihabitans sp. TG2]|uniref:TraR/DksA family transcriptional regulator n=1 Tax=Acerihabitans sp. TG2 TaxID=3096008 RepID=UPI002B23D318|nr:TraR/DksA family transcriptional regulator [Acerihabitans sp. TG2]MEA9389540.1 TraR/DksA family transcriptional regulator [Acerihabitans sp. TG2]
MADIIDLAQTRQDDILKVLIENARPKTIGASAFVCEDCNAPIPEARRIALPGVQCCVTCQQIREAHNRHYRPGR